MVAPQAPVRRSSNPVNSQFCPNRAAARDRLGLQPLWILPVLLLLTFPAVLPAQFTFTTNNGAITITGYTGPGGAVAIPSSTNGYPVTTIWYSAFQGNTNMINVSIPDSVTTIFGGAFRHCPNLTGVAIGTNVVFIDDSAFALCYSLQTLTIPNSVNYIGPAAFELCFALTNLSIGRGVTLIGIYVFESCHALTSITISNGVSAIGQGAFVSCSSLPNITIPDSVTSIGTGAFADCTSLTNAMIGNGVTNIGDNAFAYIYGSLMSVYFKGNTPTVGSVVFDGDYNATAYYLPGTTGWGAFATNAHIPTALWNPTIETTNASFGVQTNQFGFTIIGTTNIPIAVVACTNPLNPTWLPLQTCTLTNGSVYFSDPQWTNYPSRFYRIRSP